MNRNHLTLVPQGPVRLSIQGQHGIYLVQRDTEETMVDARNAAAPSCACRLHRQDVRPGECEHVALLRACGFLIQAA